jgi:L-ascorbate metabolism protein UlaG (beta-lactamase superfamily)
MVKYYLKPSVKAEPYIWRWYAWSYLIPPTTAACNIVERHLKIMQSYVLNPQLHASAVQDPAMLGGPFIDLKGNQVSEIQELIDDTNKKCKALISLNAALKECDRMLQIEALGGSLESLYNKIPDVLRGCVELVYDLNNHPSIRLIEPLLYNNYYDNSEQAIILSHVTTDSRKFALSTPKLDNENELYINLPFSDSRLDFLFKLKNKPCDLKSIMNLFDIPVSKQKFFESFFTTDTPKQANDKNYNGDGIRIRYFGHACILLETKEVSILFDPVISYQFNNNIPRYTFEDLPDKIDFVVITHNHQDHLMIEILLQLRHKIKHIIVPSSQKGSLLDPSIKLILQYIGFVSIIELSEIEKLDIEEGQIIALPFLGEHADLNIHSKLSYYINLKGRKFMFAADSNNLDEFLYAQIVNLTGVVDMLFIGMECDGAPLSWLYGPLLTKPLNRLQDRSRTLSGSNCNKAWSVVNKLECKHAYIYAMGQEPWLSYVMALNYSPDSIQILESDRFVALCKEKGIESERLFGQKEWIISTYK